MKIAELKKQIEHLPDDMLVLSSESESDNLKDAVVYTETVCKLNNGAYQTVWSKEESAKALIIA